MKEPITCSEATVDQFKHVLKTVAPEAWALAAAFHRAGLVDGLRGVRVAPLPQGLPRAPGAVRPVLSAAAESRLADLEWKRKLLDQQQEEKQ